MKVNLRKADKLYHAILAALASVEAPIVVAISEFEDPETVIMRSRTEWRHAENIRSHLYAAILEIRTKVGAMNAASGVSDILAEIANIDAKLKYREKFYAKATPTANMNIIKGRMKNITDVPVAERRRGYGESDSVGVGVLSQEMLVALGKDSATLRKRKEALKDMLLARNVETTIELSEPVVTTLKSMDIV